MQQNPLFQPYFRMERKVRNDILRILGGREEPEGFRTPIAPSPIIPRRLFWPLGFVETTIWLMLYIEI
jgi:hypothetical protein